jgi:long-chain acyl-CoA synthetase
MSSAVSSSSASAAAARTVVDVFEAAVAARPDRVMLRSKVAGAWHPTTFAQWRTMSVTWARGLVAMGLQPGERVAIISQTCREWVIADMAVLLAGGVTVPVYPAALADETRYILADSGCRFAFVEDPTQLGKLLERDALPQLERMFLFRDAVPLAKPDANGRHTLRRQDVLPAADPFVQTLALLADAGRELADRVLAERRAALNPRQACTIVYTSGTTGRPKGVVLSHAAFVFEVSTVSRALEVREDDAVMLFLPLAHIFAKVIYFQCVTCRTEMIFPESLATLMGDLAATRPTVLPAVPRIFEKAHTRILTGLAEAGPVKRKLFDAALATGREVSRLRQKGREPTGLLKVRHQLAEKVVFAKIQAVFGGRIRAFISGGAPLSTELAEFFHACGLLILEGYGLTETCAGTTVNRLERYKFGSVGAPVDGMAVRIAADGEILLRGPALMDGYWQNPEATAEAIDADGWFHTGDIGRLDDDGYLYITDRKKDLIITAGGKNVAPQNVENLLKSSPYVSQVLVYGDRRKFLSALITLDEDAIGRWARDRGIAFTNHAEVSQHPEVFRFLQAVVDDKNRSLASYETIKKFAILDHDFSIEAGELTSSLKLRRKEVTAKHLGLLESFYADHH